MKVLYRQTRNNAMHQRGKEIAMAAHGRSGGGSEVAVETLPVSIHNGAAHSELGQARTRHQTA